MKGNDNNANRRANEPVHSRHDDLIDFISLSKKPEDTINLLYELALLIKSERRSP